MICFRCGNELATRDAPNSLLCRTCETLLNVTLAPVPQPKTDRSRITELEAELAELRARLAAGWDALADCPPEAEGEAGR